MSEKPVQAFARRIICFCQEHSEPAAIIKPVED
jgi:hypothetical protein